MISGHNINMPVFFVEEGEFCMSFGLVLGGGGTRGSYHIGAYRALSELSKMPSLIVGTSIGAINGAVIAQGDFEKLVKLWENIEIERVLKIPETLKKNFNLFNVKNTPELIREIYEKKGIDTTPLKRLIDSVADEKKLKMSEIDFALVTVSVSDKKEVVMQKSEIPDGELSDYLLASACFPGLKPVKIGKSVFVDGGVLNNIPINILAKKDIQDIVVIDVGGIGVVKDVDVSGKNIITVRSDEPMVGMMDFNEAYIKKNIEYGYFDTLKAFGKCVGGRYYIDTGSYYKNREFYSRELLEGIEKAAEIFGIELFKIYTVEELISKVTSEYRRIPKYDIIPKSLKKLNEKSIVLALTRAIISENSDFLSSKLVTGILGSTYNAANAIAYFCKN